MDVLDSKKKRQVRKLPNIKPLFATDLAGRQIADRGSGPQSHDRHLRQITGPYTLYLK